MENRNSEQYGHRLARADSHDSYTASEYAPKMTWLYCKQLTRLHRFINGQLQLEADAREALPYVSRIR